VPKTSGPDRQLHVSRKLALELVDIDRRIEEDLRDGTDFSDIRKLGSLAILETRPAL
jgi:hypothetical protein